MTVTNQATEPAPAGHHTALEQPVDREPFARRVPRLGIQAGMRAVRVVHRLDGIEHDVPPDHVVYAGHSLWQAWQAHPAFRPADLIVGLDAGGIVPALAVALASRTPYRLAWKLDLDLPRKHVFHEPHARRREVFVYGELRGRRVLVVDDEVTTGQTITNLTAALCTAGADVVGVACLVEDTDGGGRSQLARQGLPLCALSTL